MRITAMAIMVIVTLGGSLAAADEGLVLHYAFDEGAGNVLHDKSGSGTDGAIKGAVVWDKSGAGPALVLNGRDTYIDCGTASPFGTKDAATMEFWCKLENHQGGFLSRTTGEQYRDERIVFAFNTYSTDLRLMVVLADGKAFDGSTVTTKPPLNAWTHITLTFDGAAVSAYYNGKKVYGFRQTIAPDAKGVPLRIGYIEGMGTPFMKGLINEVRLYNRALSEEELQGHFAAQAGAKGLNLAALCKIEATAFPLPRRGQLLVEVGIQGPCPADAALDVALKPSAAAAPICKTVAMRPGADKLRVYFDMTGFAAIADGEVTATIKDKAGSRMGQPAADKFSWPAQSGPQLDRSGVKVLNNLVSELLSKSSLQPLPSQEFSFTNPADGWVFISSTVQVEAEGRACISLDSAQKEEAVIIHSAGAASVQEAMRWLRQGKHVLKLWCDGKAQVKSLVVRAIPELIYCEYPDNPHISPYGPYDWNFLQHDVLPNANVLIVQPGLLEKDKTHVEAWKKMGKRWITICGIPQADADVAATTDRAFKQWSGQAGFQHPLADGVIVDEFIDGWNEPKYAAWAAVVERLYADPKLHDRVLYPFTAVQPLYRGKTSAAFGDAVIGHGGRIVEEIYIPEQATPVLADKACDQLRDTVIGWEKARPGATRNLILALGYLSAWESLNIDPSVDFKVFMDLQMNAIANDPALLGLYGLLYYKSSYCDEETVRWAGRLYRHYAIEGKRNLLSEELGFAYLPSHIQNPDFDDGLAGWTVAPAEDGSVRVGSFNGWSWLEGRYPKTMKGNNVLLTRRSAQKPNIVSQTIKNLKPGVLYSLKMFTADYQDMLNGRSVKQKHAVSVRIEDAELAPGKSFQEIIPNCYAHALGKFNSSNQAWLNYHWRVFRAAKPTARLVISDWADAQAPGGPVGQELMCNFIEVQPYLPD